MLHSHILPLLSWCCFAAARYVVLDDYTPSSFASLFDFFTDNDPTGGFVNYVDMETASRSGLYSTDNERVYLRVDSTQIASGRGRNSIRIMSKTAYNHGLIILDLEHMPDSVCGTWPAFWLLGPDWPNSGEVDIIEGVNTQTANLMSVHTNSGCAISNSSSFTGLLEYPDCDVYSASQPSNVGCAIRSRDEQSFGTGFNRVGGGVFAVQWDSTAILLWSFPRSAIPADIIAGSPDPRTWGLPSSRFAGDCDIDQHVRDLRIVFNIAFCGQWPDAVWTQNADCFSKATTCQAFVKDNPSAFVNTYWAINNLTVYHDDGISGLSTSRSASRESSNSIATTVPVSSYNLTRSSTIDSVPVVRITVTVTVTVTFAINVVPPSSAIVTTDTINKSWTTVTTDIPKDLRASYEY